MAAKRGAGKTGGSAGGGSGGAPPVVNAMLVVAAIGYAVWILVSRGSMTWPPNQLLASLFTVSGCLALVGPIVLARNDGEGGLGELLWMTGGILLWVFDAVALLRGEWRTNAWVTPLSYQTMGLTILAVLLAGWRCRIAGRGWSWTNVTGWVLGIFWVMLAFTSMWSSRGGGFVMR